MNRCLVTFLRGGKVKIVHYWWNIVAKLKVNKWWLSKWLSNYKPKISRPYQHNYFVVSVKLNFCWRQTHCIDDQDKFQSVTDTDNEFTECQTPRKKLQSIDISPVSLHALIKTLKSNISVAYNVQVDCLKDSWSDSYNKNDMKEKVNDLVRLHDAMQEKLKTASYSEIQIFTLVPDKWSRMYCSESFNVLECFVWTSHENKKVGGMLAKTSLKKRKNYHHLICSQTLIKMTKQKLCNLQ